MAHRFDERVLGDVEAPTLLLVGSESPAWAARSIEAHANAIPRAETRVLEGHGHGANVTGQNCRPPSSRASSPPDPMSLANPEPLPAF